MSWSIIPNILWLFGLTSALILFKDPITEQVLIGVTLICIAFIMKIVQAQKLEIVHAKFLLFGLGFWLTTYISIWTSIVSFDPYLHFGFFSALPITFLYFVINPKQFEKHKDLIIQGIVTILTLLALFALSQYFFLQDMMISGQVSYPFNNPNALGALLSLGFFVCLGQILLNQKKLWFVIPAIIIFCALLTTGSRGAIVFLLIMGSLLMIFTGDSTKNSFKQFGIFLLSLGVIYFSFSYLGVLNENAQTAVKIAESTITGKTPILWERPVIWASTWEMIKDNFWDGVGIGLFHQFYPDYRDIADKSAGYMAHNDPLQYFAECGVFAYIFFYAFVIAGIIRTWNAFFSAHSQVQKINILWPFLGAGAMLSHAHFSFGMHMLNILMVTGFLLAYWFIATSQVLNEKPKALVANFISFKNMRVVSVGLIALFMTTYALAMLSNIFISFAQKDLRKQDLKSYHKHVEWAGRLSFKQNARYYMFSTSIPMAVLEHQDGITQEQRSRIAASIEKNLNLAEKRNPKYSRLSAARNKLKKYK